MASIEETKDQILKAAEARFIQYGFNKTTMNEIAKDCNMSAANIYRFFKNKNEIVAEKAVQFFQEVEDILREIVRRPGMTAIQRLEEITLKQLQSHFDLIDNKPKLMEIIDFMSTERFDIVEHHDEVTRSLVAEVLAEGNRSGEFEVDDIVATADIFLKATILTSCPILMGFFTYKELEHFSKEVVGLLFKGLARK